MEIPLPQRIQFLNPKPPPPGWGYWDTARQHAWAEAKCEQASRERWRQIVLLLKAKLELVRLGVSTVEKEFMADMVLPNGETVNVALGREIAAALALGAMPTLSLPEASAT